MNRYVYFRQQENNYLAHHGIKGQKWGIRRYQNEDGSYTEEGKERYSLQQYKRDRDIYGDKAARRIQKRMYEDENNSVQGLRSKEADRIAKYREASKIGKKVGGVVGTVGGAVGGFFAGQAAVNRVLTGTTAGFRIRKEIGDDKARTIGTLASTVGGAAVGNVLGQIGGKTLPMLIGGYSPDKARDVKINTKLDK